MTNFDFLKKDKQFDAFSDAAIAAERILNIDAAASAMNSRRAMECAVKWMYSVDKDLVVPSYQPQLLSLMTTEEFRDIVDRDILERMHFIRKTGNDAAHNTSKVTREHAELCLENLFIFLDFVAYCYSTDDDYEESTFNRELLKEVDLTPSPVISEADLEALVAENKSLKEEMTARRADHQQTYIPKPLELSEFETRKIYIDRMLIDAGWTLGRNWQNEYELPGMPNQSEVGYADYVLFGDDGKPLAVVEAKRTCADVIKGRQQAKLYADLLEEKFSRRPVIFLTNGFDTRIWNDKFEPERKVAEIYSKRDLEKLFNLQTMRTSLKNVVINRGIAGRYYQEAAIKAVCSTFNDNKRKALIVMATGAGKTRTVAGLTEVLLNHGWIKNILFLADRNSLVTQAKRAFTNLLPDLAVTNLVEDKDNYNANCVFSTYQTMYNCIDTTWDADGRLFTIGHFDLVICDEAHRSIYNKYRDIFNYFDAKLVGLTATPKSDIDKNTYDIFDLEFEMPTYGYELSQAVSDGYLVDYRTVETKLKFIEEGIIYDDLSDKDKLEYEDTFKNEDGELPERLSSSAINDWIFNKDTIIKVIDTLMKYGHRVDYGAKMGKTIIFAKNHKHAEMIHEIFGLEYPNLPGYTKVIDNYLNYAQSAIDEFSDASKLPQIAISVDMLDTGIDIPEILNLVFFKKVLSKAKFWQMIGRGTRLCPGLVDGADKSEFLIFDFCGNFDFFRAGNDTVVPASWGLQCAIFMLKAKMVLRLQGMEYQTEELVAFRQGLIDNLVNKVRELNRDNFAVRQHLKNVEIYSNSDNYMTLTFGDIEEMRANLAHLILPCNDDVNAVRFDALIYGIELALLEEKKYTKARNELLKKTRLISGIANIPEIMAHSDIINKILHTDYIERAGVSQFEYIRESLRNLIKYIPREKRIYEINIDDEIIDISVNESDTEEGYLRNYKEKAEAYIRQNQDKVAISKLKTNIPLTSGDIGELEQILWSDIGTQDDYLTEIGEKPLGEFVREIVGLDMNAAKAAFSDYLNDTNLDIRQIFFVNQIVEYVVQNGMMKDLSILQETPFTDRGSVVEIFTDMTVWYGIRAIIDKINANALAA